MKKFRYLISFAFAGLLFGCSDLQSSLHDEMQAKLEKETGSASLAASTWYYNGTSSEDMSGEQNQTLLLNFGKKIAIGTLSGSIELTYTNAAGNSVTETFNSISGTFTEDLTGYKINLSDVISFFDTVKIPGGTALINLKAGGFKCAEGSQSGRPISTFEAKNVKIQPLYNSYAVDFSTVGFNTSSKIEYDLNGEVTLANGSYTVTGTGSDSTDYSFSVNADGSKILLTPQFSTVPADGVSVSLTLKDLVPLAGGTAFSKDITITFSRYSIIIDGNVDENFENGTVAEDASDDLDAFSSLGYTITTGADIQKVYVTNDDDYLYIGVYGSLKITWADCLSILISNGNVTGGNGARASVLCAGTEDFGTKTGSRAKQQPNVYITHQPGAGDDGTGAFSAYSYVSSTNTDISSSIKYSPAGWTQSSTGDFIEYAIPLGTSTGLNKGDDLKIIVAAGLHWGEGNAVVDAAPDGAVTYNDTDHLNVKYSFTNGIDYSIPSSN